VDGAARSGSVFLLRQKYTHLPQARNIFHDRKLAAEDLAPAIALFHPHIRNGYQRIG
jgi:hypothetical protein